MLAATVFQPQVNQTRKRKVRLFLTDLKPFTDPQKQVHIADLAEHDPTPNHQHRQIKKIKSQERTVGRTQHIVHENDDLAAHFSSTLTLQDYEIDMNEELDRLWKDLRPMCQECRPADALVRLESTSCLSSTQLSGCSPLF